MSRLTFGPRPGDVEQVRRLGVAKWIELQLHPDRIPENRALDAKLDPLETMFTAPEFFSVGAWQAKLKSPFEMVTSAVRAVGGEASETFTLVQKIADLGEPLYNKLEPNGYPNTGDKWLSTVGICWRATPRRRRRRPWSRVSKAKTIRPCLPHRWCSDHPIFSGGKKTMFTRRIFLRGSAVVMAGTGAVPSWLVRAASVEGKKRKILVAIFQRGAADGLNIVVPFSEKRYHELRPTLAIAPPAFETNANNGKAIDLDGRFALHGAMRPLKDLWDKHQLAIVEATGSPDSSRSHFDAQDYMESGTSGTATGDGWLNRALPPAGVETSPLRAVAMGKEVPHMLRGDRKKAFTG